VAIPAIIKRGPDPNGTLGTGSAGLAVGRAYLAVATGVDHLVDEFGVAPQDARSIAPAAATISPFRLPAPSLSYWAVQRDALRSAQGRAP
jgi:hypothetical protein